MSEYREYDGDTVHDMWVDFTYHEYTGELDDWFGGGNANARRYKPSPDYPGYVPTQSTSEKIDTCRTRVARFENGLKRIKANIERKNYILANKKLKPKDRLALQHALEENTICLSKLQTKLDKEQAQLNRLLIERKQVRKSQAIVLGIVALLVGLFILWLM